MNELILLCMEMVGTVAFALSGAMTALRRQMDLLGVMILGLITAVGGGVLRDLLLGITPPKVFDDPLTVCVALVSSRSCVFCRRCGLLLRSTLLFERLLLWADSLGLAAFTVVGEQIAYSHLPEGSWFAVALLGTITGVGGGVVRIPWRVTCRTYSASISMPWRPWRPLCGWFCHLYWDDTAALLMGSTVVVAIRLLAAHFRWSLPKAKVPRDKRFASKSVSIRKRKSSPAVMNRTSKNRQ